MLPNVLEGVLLVKFVDAKMLSILLTFRVSILLWFLSITLISGPIKKPTSIGSLAIHIPLSEQIFESFDIGKAVTI